MSRPQYLLWLPLGLLLFLEFNFAQELPPPEVGPNGRDGELPGEGGNADVTKAPGAASAPYYESPELHVGSSQVQYVATSITPLQGDQHLPSMDSALDNPTALDTTNESTVHADQTTPEQPVAYDKLGEEKVTSQEEGGQQPSQDTTTNKEMVADTINKKDTNYNNQTRSSSTDEITNINTSGQQQPTATKEYSNNNNQSTPELTKLAGSPYQNALTEMENNSSLDHIILENNAGDKYPNQSTPEQTTVVADPPYQNASAEAANNSSLDQIMSDNSGGDKYPNQQTPKLTTVADNMYNRRAYGQGASTEIVNNSSLDQINSENPGGDKYLEWNSFNSSDSHVSAAGGERHGLMEGRSLDGAADAGTSATNAVNNNTMAATEATQHLPPTHDKIRNSETVGGGDETKNATNNKTIMDNGNVQVISEPHKTVNSSAEVWSATEGQGEIVESIKETQIHDISKIIRYRVNDSLVHEGSNNGTRWTSNATGYHLDEVDWNKVELDSESKDIGSIQDDVNELRIQFYVVAGIAGGLFLLLILLVLAIALSISRIKDQLQHKDRRYIPQETVNTRISRQPEPVNAYINSAFNGAHEMEERSVDAKTEINRLGYDVYNGRSSNVAAETSGASEIPRAKVGERSRDYGNDQDHRRHLRLEDGVTPIGSRNGKNHGERRPERERY